jgi:hypothetical protein
MNLPQQARRHDAVSLIDDYMGRTIDVFFTARHAAAGAAAGPLASPARILASASAPAAAISVWRSSSGRRGPRSAALKAGSGDPTSGA